MGLQENIGSFEIHRNEYLSYIISDTDTPTNKYILEGDIGAPYGNLFIKPVYGESLNDITSELKHYLREEKVDVHIITDVLVGTLGYRKIAKETTYQYKILTQKKD